MGVVPVLPDSAGPNRAGQRPEVGTPDGRPSYAEARRAAIATAVVFAMSGGISATWISRIPQIRAKLGADPGQLGLALLAIGVGSVLAMPATGRLSARFGSRVVVRFACVLSAVLLVSVSLVPSVTGLGLLLLVYGMGYGTWDVAMNIQGSGVEVAANRIWMPRYHACWSVGGFSFAGLGALAAATGLPIDVHFGAVAVIAVIVVLVCTTRFLPDREQRAGVPGVARPGTAWRQVLTWSLVAVGAVTACATLVEGAAGDWLPLYLVSDRSASAGVGAGAYAVFAVAMAVSRALGSVVIARLGRVLALRVSAVVAAAGVTLLLTAPWLPLGYAGAALWGLGTAIAFPATISAAGETPQRPGDAIALVSTVGYGGFLVGPPLIGLLAQHIGLHSALWVVGALAIVMGLLAGATRPRHAGSIGVPTGADTLESVQRP